MSTSGFVLSKEPLVVESFYNAIDINGDGNVDKKELILGLTILASGTLEKKLKLCFGIFDLNRDGYIENEELTKMLQVCAKLNHKLDNKSEEEIRKWVNDFVFDTYDRYDENGDGRLSFEEFSEAAKSNKEICEIFTLEGVVPHIHEMGEEQK